MQRCPVCFPLAAALRALARPFPEPWLPFLPLMSQARAPCIAAARAEPFLTKTDPGPRLRPSCPSCGAAHNAGAKGAGTGPCSVSARSPARGSRLSPLVQPRFHILLHLGGAWEKQQQDFWPLSAKAGGGQLPPAALHPPQRCRAELACLPRQIQTLLVTHTASSTFALALPQGPGRCGGGGMQMEAGLCARNAEDGPSWLGICLPQACLRERAQCLRALVGNGLANTGAMSDAREVEQRKAHGSFNLPFELQVQLRPSRLRQGAAGSGRSHESTAGRSGSTPTWPNFRLTTHPKSTKGAMEG